MSDFMKDSKIEDLLAFEVDSKFSSSARCGANRS